MGDYQAAVTAVVSETDVPQVERRDDGEVVVTVVPEVKLSFDGVADAARWAADLVGTTGGQGPTGSRLAFLEDRALALQIAVADITQRLGLDGGTR